MILVDMGDGSREAIDYDVATFLALGKDGILNLLNNYKKVYLYSICPSHFGVAVRMAPIK